MDRMVPLIQQIAVAAVNAAKPATFNFGTVTSETPLNVTISQKEVIEEQNIVFLTTVSQGEPLRQGEVIALGRIQGGKKYIALGRIGYQALWSDGAPSELPTKEVDWLAALVYYEARGMDAYCKELTATVVLNRVKSQAYSFRNVNTIEAVLKQSGQYGYGLAGYTATKIFNSNWREEPEAIRNPALVSACYAAAQKVANGSSRDENGAPWPENVLFQHSFNNPNRLGTGLFRTFTQGAYFMHFNYYNGN